MKAILASRMRVPEAKGLVQRLKEYVLEGGRTREKRGGRERRETGEAPEAEGVCIGGRKDEGGKRREGEGETEEAPEAEGVCTGGRKRDGKKFGFLLIFRLALYPRGLNFSPTKKRSSKIFCTLSLRNFVN
jgi:hypothetical protein